MSAPIAYPLRNCMLSDGFTQSAETAKNAEYEICPEKAEPDDPAFNGRVKLIASHLIKTEL